MQCPPKLTEDLFPSFLSFPTGLAHVGLCAWADEVGSLPQASMLVLGVVGSLCPVLCDCSSFYFLPKKERRLQISYKLAAIYQMILWSSVWYKEERLGKQDQNRVLLLSKCFPLSSVSNNGHIYFICMHELLYIYTTCTIYCMPVHGLLYFLCP